MEKQQSHFLITDFGPIQLSEETGKRLGRLSHEDLREFTDKISAIYGMAWENGFKLVDENL